MLVLLVGNWDSRASLRPNYLICYSKFDYLWSYYLSWTNSCPFSCFFVFLVSFSIFFFSHLICSDYSVETLVNTSTFLNTWSSISLSMGLALIDLLIRNKLPNKEGLSALDLFKFTCTLGKSKIRLDANTYIMILSPITAYHIYGMIYNFCQLCASYVMVMVSFVL